MLTENALMEAVFKYNHRRGVQKTSLHAFQYTFARKYLADCQGNAFMLLIIFVIFGALFAFSTFPHSYSTVAGGLEVMS